VRLPEKKNSLSLSLSLGEYWGEQGWARIERGQDTLKLESSCDWAVGSFSKTNYPCYEGGENCQD